MVLSCHQAFHAISHKESEIPSIMSAHNLIIAFFKKKKNKHLKSEDIVCVPPVAIL